MKVVGGRALTRRRNIVSVLGYLLGDGGYEGLRDWTDHVVGFLASESVATAPSHTVQPSAIGESEVGLQPCFANKIETASHTLQPSVLGELAFVNIADTSSYTMLTPVREEQGVGFCSTGAVATTKFTPSGNGLGHHLLRRSGQRLAGQSHQNEHSGREAAIAGLEEDARGTNDFRLGHQFIQGSGQRLADQPLSDEQLGFDGGLGHLLIQSNGQRLAGQSHSDGVSGWSLRYPCVGAEKYIDQLGLEAAAIVGTSSHILQPSRAWSASTWGTRRRHRWFYNCSCDIIVYAAAVSAW
mmetsp:Transcript_70368/g.228752  ORF Transcript_70368/g.228752 Transcript_70368/m.228752 type:complete len:297 (-) Transcript_70368:398-1288(-)